MHTGAVQLKGITIILKLVLLLLPVDELASRAIHHGENRLRGD